jgi:predicted nucleic acid-binding Zn ribbon protein
MPTYVYEIIRDDGKPGERFELFQSIHEESLKTQPGTDKPVKRVIQAAYIGGKFSESKAQKAVQDDRKLESLGFTKYVKTGKGYKKTCGKGPDMLKKPTES